MPSHPYTATPYTTPPQMSMVDLHEFDWMVDYARPWIWWLIGFYLTIPVTMYIIMPFIFYLGPYSSRKTVTILVLGDLGHSPRMCYHAQSFASLGNNVNLCGYLESAPPVLIVEDVNIDITPIEVIHNKWGAPYLVFAFYKVVIQFWQLLRLLFQMRGSNYFVIQNPPSLPLLIMLVAFIKLFSRRSRLVIDWHNLNYTILSLKFQSDTHPLVRLMRLYESSLAGFAWLNITVTDAMKKFLIDEFGLKPESIVVLHDRPGSQFVPLRELHILKAEVLDHEIFANVKDIEKYKILVSATSFTPDEDFRILLNALSMYAEDKNHELPNLFVIVTGKGPMREQFLHNVQKLNLGERVIVKNAWLSAEDYPLILSVADLAISLHTSLSGIDLPMKIVDFFGVGVPVISLSFPAITELVKDNVNGLLTKPKLGIPLEEAKEIYRLLTECFLDQELYHSIHDGALQESRLRWDQNWIAKFKGWFF